MRRTVTTMLGALALTGCSIGADVPAADKAIIGFHNQLNAAQFEAMYTQSSKEMQDSTTPARNLAFLGAVHRKLGLFKSGKSVGWNDNVNGRGHFITINYQATYEHGPATETFVYRIDNGKATLNGYNVDAEALILN